MKLPRGFKFTTNRTSPSNNDNVSPHGPSMRRYRRVSRKELSKIQTQSSLKAIPSSKLGNLKPIPADIGVVTWNVGNMDPMADDPNVLSLLLPVTQQSFDIFVICVQECRYDVHRGDRGESNKSTISISARDSAEASDSENDDLDCAHTSMDAPRRPKTLLVPAIDSSAIFNNKLTSGFSSARFAVAGMAHHMGFTKKHSFVFDTLINNHMKSHNFLLLASESLMQMRTYVYIHTNSPLCALVDNIEVATEATGLLHIYGNKGGSVVRINIKDTSLAFFNCHLAAHQDYASQRRANVVEVMQGAKVGRRELDVQMQTTHTFFVGDLNYRLDPGYRPGKTSTLSLEERRNQVRELLCAQDHSGLLKHDQLLCDLTNDGFMPGFVDTILAYPHIPTFKLARNLCESTVDSINASTEPQPHTRHSNELDVPQAQQQHVQHSRSSIAVNNLQFSGKRIPSFCDRILYHSLPSAKSSLDLKSLKVIEGIHSSDHLPVMAVFGLTVRPIPTPTARRTHPRIQVTEIRCTTAFHVTRITIGSMPVGFMREVVCRPVSSAPKVSAADEDMRHFEPQQLHPLIAVDGLGFLDVLVCAWSKKKLVGQHSIQALGLGSTTKEIFVQLELNGETTRCWLQASFTMSLTGRVDGHRSIGTSKFLPQRAPSWTRPISFRTNRRSLFKSTAVSHSPSVLDADVKTNPSTTSLTTQNSIAPDGGIAHHIAKQGAEEIVSSAVNRYFQKM
eukprot:c642_g1_i1.p1 GENE.c642_g1_i1~~c642_g1_i1.p1  ORF type:complete len:733 (-),score=143.05 c642_g1_i1:70-2268(-)